MTMLTIETEELQKVQKEVAALKAEYQNKLWDMRADITRSKQELADRKNWKKAGSLSDRKYFDSLITLQRELVQKLEANYANAYAAQPSFATPVYVKAYGGAVLVNWDFLQAMLRKMKGMILDFIARENGKVLEVSYRSFNGKARGCFEMHYFSLEYAERLQNIPIVEVR